MQAETAEAIETVEFEEEETTSSSAAIDLQPPPFAEVHDGPDYDKSTVTIELTNNTRAKGKLLKFNAVDESIRILEPRAVVPTDIDMDTIKYMCLEKLYQLMIGSPGTPGLDVDTEARSFEVYFNDRTELTGKTYGTSTDKNGIHIYEQTKVGRKWRYCTHLFVVHAAIETMSSVVRSVKCWLKKSRFRRRHWTPHYRISRKNAPGC